MMIMMMTNKHGAVALASRISGESRPIGCWSSLVHQENSRYVEVPYIIFDKLLLTSCTTTVVIKTTRIQTEVHHHEERAFILSIQVGIPFL